MNLQYSTDIKEYALYAGHEAIDGSSTYDDFVKEQVNRHYMSVWMGGKELDPSIDENWWWLRKNPPGVLVMNPGIKDGTVAVTNGSATVTFSSAPAIDVTGWLFYAVGGADAYRIISHTAANPVATLDTIYTNESNAAADYRLVQIQYAVAADVLRLVSPMRVNRQNTNYDPYKVYGTNTDRMATEWPINDIHMGVPEQFATVEQAGNTYTVQFNRYGFDDPGAYIRVEYDYLFRPAMLTFAPSEEPVIPWEYRQIVADATAYELLKQKNDDQATAHLASAQAGLRAMAKENRFKRITISAETGQIMPREWTRYSRVLRTETGVIIG